MADITKKTIVERIEVVPSGILQVLINIAILDGDQTIARKNHRTIVEPGTPVAVQMEAVNAHLTAQKEPLVGEDDIARIQRVADAIHTPDVVEAYAATRSAARAEP